MKKIAGFILVAVSLILVSCQDKTQTNSDHQTYLVVLSLDGFRWDYPDHMNTQVLDSLKRVGVKAESLQPSFPTKTFPNHYTIATGLYPDHHGIVLNSFYAEDLGKRYSIRDREAIANGAFYGGEPIWVTAENQSVKTASLFWVGASAKINGVQPSYWSFYDEELPFASRIDSIYNWLSLPVEQRPQLIMWYYHEPDYTGHDDGPYGDSTKAVVEKLDTYLGDFFTRMRTLPIFDRLNFIITSDHGMAETSAERVVLLDQYIDTADIDFFDGMDPVLNIKVKPGKLEKVYRQLINIPHIYAWKHDSLPERLHYGTNIRTQDICVVAYPGWAISTSWRKGYYGGSHGYDNAFTDMHAIFYAAGPAFKKEYLQPTFENVNIYPLMAEILGLNPADMDGKLKNVAGMLR